MLMQILEEEIIMLRGRDYRIILFLIEISFCYFHISINCLSRGQENNVLGSGQILIMFLYNKRSLNPPSAEGPGTI